MAPVVGSSNPATIRRIVDLPQPDGPSSTMNSPSPTSRLTLSTAMVPSLKTFVTSLSATVATPPPPDTLRESGSGGYPLRSSHSVRSQRRAPSGEQVVFD